MNFKLPKIPNVSNIQNLIPTTVPPIITNLPIESVKTGNTVNNIPLDILNEVSKSIPDIMANSPLNKQIPNMVLSSLPSIDETVQLIFDKILEEYDLTKNEVILLVVLALITIISLPSILAVFYNEFLSFHLIYCYLIVLTIAGVSLSSFALSRETRNPILIINGIIFTIVTIKAFFGVYNDL